MPQAPRTSKKARKIFYKIMGTPPDMIDQETEKERKVKNMLIYEEGQWTR